jgi:hypothetical protein
MRGDGTRWRHDRARIGNQADMRRAALRAAL